MALVLLVFDGCASRCFESGCCFRWHEEVPPPFELKPPAEGMSPAHFRKITATLHVPDGGVVVWRQETWFSGAGFPPFTCPSDGRVTIEVCDCAARKATLQATCSVALPNSDTCNADPIVETLSPSKLQLQPGYCGRDCRDGYDACPVAPNSSVCDRWHSAPAPQMPRDRAAAAVLADGRVLVVGGAASFTGPAAELFDPDAGAWTASWDVPASSQVDATTLDDGRVLVTGAGPLDDQALLFEPADGGWTQVPMVSAHVGHVAQKLDDGRVLVAGGWDGNAQAKSSAEIFDPATSTFSPAADMHVARFEAASALLPGGEVFVFGGDLYVASDGGPSLGTAEIYSPDAGAWRSAAATPLKVIEPVAATLPDGRVLVVGQDEYYDPSADNWSPSCGPDVIGAAMVELRDGSFLVLGGYTRGGVLDIARRYRPGLGWAIDCPMPVAMSEATAALLPDGRVLVVGSSAVLYTGP